MTCPRSHSLWVTEWAWDPAASSRVLPLALWARGSKERGEEEEVEGEEVMPRWKSLAPSIESRRPPGEGGAWGAGERGCGAGEGGIPRQLKASFLVGSQVFMVSSDGWNAGVGSLLDFGLCLRPQAGETLRNVPLAF